MPDLFQYREESTAEVSRESWLRFYFGSQQTFNHRGAEFYYRPQDDSEARRRGLLYGWIGRERTIHERTSPEEGFEPTTRSQWLAAFVAIDPSAHEDGQKVAVEDNPEIGKASALIKSLVRNFSERSEAPFYAQVFPILAQGSFWQFAKEHDDRIRSITFDVAAPNMFNDAQDFQNELRALRDRENVANVKTTLESDSALNFRTERISEIVDYTEKGAGTLSAESVDGAHYSSEDHEKSVRVPIEAHDRGLAQFLRDFAYWIDRVFP